MGFIVLEAVLLGELGFEALGMVLDVFPKVGVVHGGYRPHGLLEKSWYRV